MRIISGTLRGRRLQPPVNLPVRPTTDFAKEGLFNVLNNMIDFEDLTVLDLFTGTGSIAFEFISRGAAEVTVVDSNQKCIDFIKKTMEVFGVENLRPYRSDSFSFLKHAFKKYDLVYADPPYDLEGIDKLPDLVVAAGMLAPDGMLILEHSAKYNFEDHPDFTGHRKYGSVNFSFFKSKDQQ